MAARTPQLPMASRQQPSPPAISRSSTVKVEALLRDLLPQCSQEILDHLNREGISMADQLADMDKQDLREVGFNIAERNRVLQWARSWHWSSEHIPEDEQGDEQDDDIVSYPSKSSMRTRGMVPGTPSMREFQRTGSNRTMDVQRGSHEYGFALNSDEFDDLETQEEFWYRCAGAQPSAGIARQISQSVEDDVRENLLEQQFDCTPERINEVWESVKSDAGSSENCVAELRAGLQRFGIQDMRENTLKEIIRKFTGDMQRGLKSNEFESALTRLKLAQLLIGPLRSQPGSPGGDSKRLIVYDYSASSNSFKEKTITSSNTQEMKEFFFGHRQKVSKYEDRVVRWVHMSSFERELLLALTVKYTLHPLGVEDVFEQCPTKVDRYGRHYFIAIELLTTATPLSGEEMVVVEGRHVTVFCAGPPLLDTVITVDQAEHTFAEEWPRPLSKGEESTRCSTTSGSSWLNKLRERFKAGRSRLRERKGDFLVYSIVDLCTDELVRVTRAYINRVSYLEAELRRSNNQLRLGSPQSGNQLRLGSPQSGSERSYRELPPEIFGEAAQAQLQLAVVARRVKCLRSVVRKFLKDTSFSISETSNSNYWADCEEHLDDAYDDAVQCGERCAALMKAFERAVDKLQDQARRDSDEQLRHQQLKDEQQGERLNKILFVMTVGELCFAPVQFMAGVYGMNFMDEAGVPTMPELLTPDGYWWFWRGVVTYLIVALCVTICIYRKLLLAPSNSNSRFTQARQQVSDMRNWMQLPTGFRAKGAERQDGRYVRLPSGDNAVR